MLLKSVFIGFLSFHSVDTTIHSIDATMLKECKSEEDKISGCVNRYYYESGNLKSEIPYKNGEKEGIGKWYYENGNIRREIPYGKVDGIVKKYYESGNLEREIPYKNGEREGIGKWYYESGNLWIETPYKNDKREGIAKQYYENGNLMAEMSFLNNLFHGDMKYYTEDGKLLALLKIENYEFISGKCFNDKVLIDKELKEFRRIGDTEERIIYLKETCLKESDSK